MSESDKTRMGHINEGSGAHAKPGQQQQHCKDRFHPDTP